MTDVTLETYNKSAKDFREYFKGIGSRIDDVELALTLAGKKDNEADVLEIGCGDGRDAVEILRCAKSYKGFDYSESFIKLAKELLPGADFSVEDMFDFNYPTDTYDVVFAFASILHTSKENFSKLIPRIAGSLRASGIFYISLKYGEEYREEWKEDQFGKRLFYYYNPDIVSELADKHFEVVHTNQTIIGHTKWFEVALRKK